MNAPAPSNLTHNAVQTMSQMDSSMDDEFFVPIMQVLRLKRLHDDHNEKWAVGHFLSMYIILLCFQLVPHLKYHDMCNIDIAA